VTGIVETRSEMVMEAETETGTEARTEIETEAETETEIRVGVETEAEISTVTLRGPFISSNRQAAATRLPTVRRHPKLWT
jgi:hypothetical protein